MLTLSQALSSSKGLCNSQCCCGGGSTTTCCSFSSTAATRSVSFSLSSSSPKIYRPAITRFPKPNPKTRRFSLISANSQNGTVPNPTTNNNQQQQQGPSTSTSSSSSSPVIVGPEGVPLEGVIQFDKPSSSSRIQKWGKIGLLAGGDVLALLMFAAIGRFSHGFPVFDPETLRTADPFIAGWFLSAYFLGGYSEDGRGMNGLSKAVLAAAKSWALGVPIGLGIRALSSGHFPPTNFILVTLGSTAVLLIGWRTVLFQLLPGDKGKKDDMYRRGNPFELFELLTSLVRRW